MIKNLKIVVILICVMIVSACSVDYELLITEDHRFLENAKITIPRDFLPTNDAVARQRIEERLREIRQQEPAYNRYFIDYRFTNDYVFVTIDREYSDFQNYRNSPLFQNVYQRADVEEKDYYQLTFSNLIIFESEEGLMPTDWEDNLRVIIRSYNAVEETNADEENFLTNTFVWDFSYEDEEKERDIEMLISYSPRYDIIMWDFFRKYYLAIFIILAIGVSGGVAYFYYKAADRTRNEI